MMRAGVPGQPSLWLWVRACARTRAPSGGIPSGRVVLGVLGSRARCGDGARRLTLPTSPCLAYPLRERGLRRLVALGTPGNDLAVTSFGRRGPEDRRARRLVRRRLVHGSAAWVKGRSVRGESYTRSSRFSGGSLAAGRRIDGFVGVCPARR